LQVHAPASALIAAAFDRLTDPGPTGMGSLFKAIALASTGIASLPGFGSPNDIEEQP
jgi:NADH dehydrogenase [ubiquinone] 1 alpha subcomplex assembly factor 7